MKKLLLALALCLAPVAASASCSGTFPAATFCGSVAGGAPGPVAASAIPGLLPLPSADIFVGSAGGIATARAPTGTGDCTFTFTNLGVFGYTCLKTNGVAFAASATTDTTNASNIGSGTLGSARLPSPFTSGTRQGNTSAFVTFAGSAPTSTHLATWDANGNIQDGGPSTGLVVLTEALGRITLTANTPVMTTTASAQATLRYDCYIGNQVPYYTGTADALDTISSCEVTDAMVSAASAGQVVSGQIYDVWWVHGGANRICLAMSSSSGGGGGWASDTGGSSTSRGTGYTQIDRITRGYPTNKNSITNCFNAATNYGPVSANQGTYLGTVIASANGQITWSIGGSASGGTAGVLGVWNMYNRVNVVATVVDSGTGYTYSGGTIRQARASAGNQVSFVIGLQEDTAILSYATKEASNGGAATALGVGVCLDSTSSYSGSAQSLWQSQAATVISIGQTTGVQWQPGQGSHFAAGCENSDGSSNHTFDNASTNTLFATMRM